MASKIKKLKFLDFLAVTPYSVLIDDDGISEEGEPIEALKASGKGIYTEKVKRIIDAKGKQITLNGWILIEGDIAPDLPTIASGTCKINGKDLNIYAGHRVFNPDGTVNHTKLELM